MRRNLLCRSALALIVSSVLYACGSDAVPAESRLAPRGSGQLGTTAPTIGRSAVVIGAEAACAAISQEARNERTPADIIIAVDNSGSMSEEIGFVRDQLNAFFDRIVASGVDVRIILISAAYGPAARAEDDEDDESDEDEENGLCVPPPLGSGDCPSDSFGHRFLHVAQEVKSHDALELIIDTYPEWRDRLRVDATKVFVVVTDDDSDSSAGWFEQAVLALPGGLFSRWRFSGIYCQSECPEAAAVGGVYRELVSRTHGVAGDLCQQDFAPVFDALARAVVETSDLTCAWDIPLPPAGLAFDRNRVNVQYRGANALTTQLPQTRGAADCGPVGGWYYDDLVDPRRILACPVSCAALQSDPGAAVDVLFGCSTQLVPE